MCHHCDSAKEAMRQAIQEAPITHEYLRHIYGERGTSNVSVTVIFTFGHDGEDNDWNGWVNVG